MDADPDTNSSGLFGLAEEFCADCFDGHILAGPDAESGLSLVEQHIEPVGGATADFARFFKQPGAARIVYDIRYRQIRMQAGEIGNRQRVRMRSHSDRGRVGQQGAALQRLANGGLVVQVNDVCLAGGSGIDRAAGQSEMTGRISGAGCAGRGRRRVLIAPRWRRRRRLRPAGSWLRW